jgi:hypothetical protein
MELAIVVRLVYVSIYWMMDATQNLSSHKLRMELILLYIGVCGWTWCDFLLAFSLFALSPITIVDLITSTKLPVPGIQYVALESDLRTVHMGDIAS